MAVGRKIEKKVISDDLLFADDFDENRLARIEDELNRSPEPDSPKGKQRKRAEAGEPEAPTAPDPVSSPPEDAPDLEFEASSEPPTQSEIEAASDRQRQAVAKMVRSKRILLLAATSVLVVIAAGLAYLLWPHQKQAPLSPQILRHRIVIPSYVFDANFLIFVGTADKKKDLMKLDLELDFGSPEAHEQFKSKQLLYCDVIYEFLRKQQPQDNSFQYWEEVLTRDLFESLKQDYPEIRLNSIHMKNFHRL